MATDLESEVFAGIVANEDLEWLGGGGGGIDGTRLAIARIRRMGARVCGFYLFAVGIQR